MVCLFSYISCLRMRIFQAFGWVSFLNWKLLSSFIHQIMPAHLSLSSPENLIYPKILHSMLYIFTFSSIFSFISFLCGFVLNHFFWPVIGVLHPFKSTCCILINFWSFLKNFKPTDFFNSSVSFLLALIPYNYFSAGTFNSPVVVVVSVSVTENSSIWGL